MKEQPAVISLRAENDDTLLRIVQEVLHEYAPDPCWHIEKSADPGQQWLRCTYESAPIPSQGWKLHISATIDSAEAVLRRALPVLFSAHVHFKVAASLQKLQLLNYGFAGNSQIGKFITVYPKDAEEAVQLAVTLDKATCGLSGPNVPSDHVLHPGSLIYYRYGGMGSTPNIQTQLGLIVPALEGPDNQLVSDQRSTYYKAPDWVVDPFIAAGVATELPTPARIIGNRYLIVTTIYASPTHLIQLGADLEQGRSCIIKGPGYAWLNNPTDPTCANGLHHEADILARLAPDPHIPAVFDLCEQDGNCYLVIEDVEGESLLTYVNNSRHGKPLPLTKAVEWGKELAEILSAIHAKGLIYADLKPPNVLVDKQERLHLIDFEMAHKQGDRSFIGHGTRGYTSPQRRDYQPTTIYDDIYSFGALLYFMVTQAEPSLAAHPFNLLERPLETLRPGIAAPFKELIARCLQEQPEARYASMDELKAALEAMEGDMLSSTALFGHEERNADASEAGLSYRELARELLATICAEARPSPSGQGLAWTSTHPMVYGLKSRDINTGNSGVVLALAELVAELDEPNAWLVLKEGAQWLQSAPPVGQRRLPGLYVGESGVGAALLRAGQVLHDEHLIAAAVKQGHLVATMPYASPDILQGTAGRLRFHLLLWDETKDDAHLQAAIACGEQLLATAEIANGEARWTIPEGYDGLSGYAYLGYAHGAAGIGDALLDLFEATLDERFVPVIQKTGRWLMRQTIRDQEDESIVSWPHIVGGKPAAPFWCHGGTGIGRFFLHAALCDLMPDALDMAVCAAMTMSRSTRWANTTQCHGLAGNIEFLLDLYQATQENAYLSEAFSLGSLLKTFATERNGHLVFPSEEAHVFTPDYMVGYAGVAMTLLRLSAPERLPYQLSRAGFHARTLESAAI